MDIKQLSKIADSLHHWDDRGVFFDGTSDEAELLDAWYRYQKSGDPVHIGKFISVLSSMFPMITEWKDTTPNTGKATVTAIYNDSMGNDMEIASIDLSGNRTSVAELQSFLDKCDAPRNWEYLP